jgi:hypothetical protein
MLGGFAEDATRCVTGKGLLLAGKLAWEDTSRGKMGMCLMRGDGAICLAYRGLEGDLR